MAKFLLILQIAIAVFSMLSMTGMMYQVVMALFSFRRRKLRPNLTEEQFHRFAVITSARNEELVIGHLVNSLTAQDYPRDHFDIYVIADNCTDNTAQVAEQCGAIVKVRNDTVKIGKGYALKWLFDQLQEERPGAYDAFCVFDADNLAHTGFLSAMNRELCYGEDMAQGYRDIKNPGDTWVSGAYAIYFWCLSRFCFLPRDNMRISCIANGTGFMFRSSLIAATGWNTTTITEDSEFSIQQILEGKRVAFVEDAVFYDEQPTKFRQSIRQRYRWAVGNMQCFFLYMPKVWKMAKTGISIRLIDLSVFLLIGPCTAFALINMLLSAIMGWALDYTSIQILITTVVPLALSSLLMMAHGLLTVRLEKKRIKTVIKGILGWPLFLYSGMCIGIFALFAKKVDWKPIPHTKGVGLQSVADGSEDQTIL